MNENKEFAVTETEVTEKKAPKKKSLFNFKANRKLRLGTTATALTAVVVAAVIVFNVIVGMLYDRFPLSFDLTEENLYTMSDIGREVAKSVKQDVEILVFSDESAFASPTATDQIDGLDVVYRQFYLFTQEYGKLSGGRVTTKYLDIEANPAIKDQYSNYNISLGSILFRTEKHTRVLSIADFLTLEQYSEYYDYYYCTSLVEQQLASAVNAVCAERNVTLTFLTGHGEDETMIETLQSLYKLNGYNVDRLNLTTAAKIPEDTEMMIIVAPVTDFKENEIITLRSWLRNDDKLNRDLMVFCNYLGNCPNLYNFLEADYGITVTDQLIAETDADSYREITGKRVPVTTITNTDLTGECAAQEIMVPDTLQLKIAHGTDTNAESVTNYPILGFSKETAKLISVKDLKKEGEDTPMTAADSDPLGMVYAKKLNFSSEHQGETNVIVSGSYFNNEIVAMLFPELAGESLLLEPVRSVCSLGETVSIPSMSLDSETFDLAPSESLAIEIALIAIPVVLIIACLVVFLRRRHL